MTSPDETHDMRRWLAATPARKLELLRAIAARFGREARAIEADAEPRRYRSGGPRLIHRRSGLRFCLVPGGAARVGAGAAEAIGLGPFLLAEEALGVEDAARLGIDLRRPGRPLTSDDDAPIYLAPDEIAGVLAQAPLRLPSDVEWEVALRAGTTTAFFWGDVMPSAPPALPHPLGLVRPGWWDELTSDDRIRGGGARLWPWGDGDGWLTLASHVSRPREGAAVVLRLALSIG